MGDIEVREVERSVCDDLVLNVHYAGRYPSVSRSFAAYEDGDLLGCVTYGSPFSSTLRKGIAGAEFADKVIELNRLALYENQHNLASILVGHSLRVLRQDGDRIVVSFADTSQGHVGVVYQATNFMYCGLSAKRTDWTIRGQEHLHGQTVSDMFRGQKGRASLLRERYGDDFYLKPRPRKHRYIRLLGSKTFKRKVMRNLKYKIEPNPIGLV
jgi:hypothetical protein